VHRNRCTQGHKEFIRHGLWGLPGWCNRCYDDRFMERISINRGLIIFWLNYIFLYGVSIICDRDRRKDYTRILKNIINAIHNYILDHHWRKLGISNLADRLECLPNYNYRKLLRMNKHVIAPCADDLKLLQDYISQESTVWSLVKSLPYLGSGHVGFFMDNFKILYKVLSKTYCLSNI